jgi:glyoxylase-like metal-dependent hydrolase (beta-lactamase superfamily II)
MFLRHDRTDAAPTAQGVVHWRQILSDNHTELCYDIKRRRGRISILSSFANAPVYEVLALRYATTGSERRRHENFIASPDLHDGPMPMDYYVWAIRNEARVVVVDTGFEPEAARKRKRMLLHAPADLLRRAGIEPEQVSDVILTHLHYDHAGGLSAFPNARFHLQDAEMAFATGRYICHACLRAPFEVEDVLSAVRLAYEGRIVFHSGDAEVFPGISVHRIGGHSGGLQAVRVATQRGPLVLASDAFHFRENLKRRSPFPIVFHVGEMLEGFFRCEALAEHDQDLLIPGHDPEVARRWPPLAPDLLDVFRLDLPPTLPEGS